MTHDKDILPELPMGWVWTRIDDFSVITQGQSPPSSTYNQSGNGLPFYQGKAEFGTLYPTPENWCVVPKKIAEKGDVLISVRAPVGPTNICPDKSCIGRGLAAIRGLGGSNTFFILYLLRAFERVLAEKGTGTTFNAITGDTLRNLVLPLPPLPEQKRIVAKIEELFTRLDAGVEALKKVKTEIKRYRQAVLKHAFEGRLTEEWREAHKGELESASILMERIKEERKKNAKGKCKELPPVNASDLPGLPEGWMSTTINEIVAHDGVFIDGDWVESKDQDPKGEVRLIQLADIGDGAYRNKSDRYLTNSKANELNCTFLKPDDVLIARMPDPLGRACLFPGDSKSSVTVVDVCIVRTGTQGANHRWLMYTINSPYFRTEIADKQSGSTRKRISRGNLAKLKFPLPPLPEQHKIIEEIERRFSIADEVEKVAGACLAQAQRLRQSILKRAFEGKLVSQDPTDEPASALLERIRLNRESKKGIKTGRRKPRGEKYAGMA